ncbi:hypothetical protein [Deinococcus ficus]|uniref:hypothetical protein n=1 Tax=Deinococcus ficus TaxID=317577 RepID=UPI00174A44FE
MDVERHRREGRAVRPSGTEPVVRLYVEASTEQDVHVLLDTLRALRGWGQFG